MPESNPRYCTPRSAYIHVPFCRHRCGYCNFTLVAGRDDLIDGYLRALERELSWLDTPRPVDTQYFGGGTPSHLGPRALRQLIECAARWLPRASDAEFSVEANPLDLAGERLSVLRDGGVTRLSLGVQSFADRKLEVLERDHRRADVERSYRAARCAVPTVSLDLIFGAPGETLDEWRGDLRAALALQPDHLSLYGLTWERGTSFWGRRRRGQLAPCGEELERAMYELAIDMLADAGFEHYEVSNFARPGRRCRHNEVYWTGRTYFAAGPGAARFLDGRRELNHRSTTTYIRRVLAGQSPVAETELLPPEDAAREQLVFGLRRLDGVETRAFRSETGYELPHLAGEALARYVDHGWLAWHDSRIRLTRAGLLISDSLWPDLLAPRWNAGP